jgi:hypothetical protein
VHFRTKTGERKKMAVVIGFMWLLAMTSPSLSQTEYERQQQKQQKMLPELDRLLVTSAVMIKIYEQECHAWPPAPAKDSQEAMQTRNSNPPLAQQEEQRLRGVIQQQGGMTVFCDGLSKAPLITGKK